MKHFKTLFPSLVVAFGAAALSGCESQIDIDAKPGVAATLLETSQDQVLITGPVHGEKEEYATRLNYVLMDTTTQALRTLHEHHVTVCLDQRLAEQKLDWADRQIKAIYYPNGAQGGVIAIYDNGKMPEETGIFTSNYAYNYGSGILEKFASKLSDGEVYSAGNMYAARYSSGKTHHTRWKSAADFDQDTIAKNPDLQKPPVKIPAASTITPSAPAPR